MSGKKSNCQSKDGELLHRYTESFMNGYMETRGTSMQLPTKVALGGGDWNVESQMKKKVPQLGNKGYSGYYDDGLCKEGVEFYSKINDQVLHGDYKIKNFPQENLDKKFQSRKILTLGARGKPIVDPLKKTTRGNIFSDQKNQKIRNINSLSYPSLST